VATKSMMFECDKWCECSCCGNCWLRWQWDDSRNHMHLWTLLCLLCLALQLFCTLCHSLSVYIQMCRNGCWFMTSLCELMGNPVWKCLWWFLLISPCLETGLICMETKLIWNQYLSIHFCLGSILQFIYHGHYMKELMQVSISVLNSDALSRNAKT
jgi:hypothetical protein